MPKGSPDTVAAYLRIPRTAHGTLSATAEHLGIPLSRVTNAVFHYMLSPLWFREGWDELVRTLREHLEDHGDAVCLHDFTARDWQSAKKQVYSQLERVGLVEDFQWRRSSAATDRILCSFKVSEAGRVIADLYKSIGGMDDPDDDFELTDEGDEVAS